MKKYRIVEQSEVNQDVLAKIMKAIAMVHHYPVPDFLIHKRSVHEPLTVEQITDCVDGWLSVLREHKGHFDEEPLEKKAEKINSIIQWHNTGETNLIHADFHLNNLLFDDEGEIVICDWQSVAVGHSSNDLGFFLSRFNADGARISEKEVIDLYSKAVYELYGKTVDGESIHRHLAASTLVTSFLFWHHFLHGVPKEKVEQVYCEMVGIISSYMFPII